MNTRLDLWEILSLWQSNFSYPLRFMPCTKKKSSNFKSFWNDPTQNLTWFFWLESGPSTNWLSHLVGCSLYHRLTNIKDHMQRTNQLKSDTMKCWIKFFHHHPCYQDAWHSWMGHTDKYTGLAAIIACCSSKHGALILAPDPVNMSTIIVMGEPNQSINPSSLDFAKEALLLWFWCWSVGVAVYWLRGNVEGGEGWATDDMVFVKHQAYWSLHRQCPL